MSGSGVGAAEAQGPSARSRALSVLRVRSRALAVALLPAAVAVILLAGGSTGHLPGAGWDLARRIVTPVAVLVLLLAAGVALVVVRARPAMSPTVPIAEEAAPDLYRMVRDLADRLDVPAPSAIALTPDCDSWLEDRTHPAHGPPPAEEHGDIAGAGRPPRGGPAAPVLVIGSPFLWWMRVGELRAVLAPVVAGTGPSAHPDIAAARRFVQGLDAAAAVTSAPRRGPVSRRVLAGVGWVARLLLRGCREHVAEMERGVAAAAADRAQAVDYGVRIVAQEQVGLAYAGWDRLLTRVALPAWRMGRWPSRLNAGVVAALTELSRRDRLAEGFASRLGERPACDLLEEPGAVDEATSLLAARLFHGGPAESGPDWSPVHWGDYPEEVVDRKWRTDAARLHRILDGLHVPPPAPGTPPPPDGPTLTRVLAHLTTDPGPGEQPPGSAEPLASAGRPASGERPGSAEPLASAGPPTSAGPSGSLPDPGQPPVPWDGDPLPSSYRPSADTDPVSPPDPDGGVPPSGPGDVLGDDDDLAGTTPHGAALAARLSAELAREEVAAAAVAASAVAHASAAGAEGTTASGTSPDPAALRDDRALPLFPLQAPRTARELLADHITAMVCCAAMDTAGATPGLDWLDGPTLILGGTRAADLSPQVLALIEDGDPADLRLWLTRHGIRPEKPVRLV
ncbi:hypothetical protein HTV45_31540 [Streptomyces sp. CHD11]|uniref:hypothetical protein n=1 Tax=Streptomyces sp. CHD11 TaxID=2741325 RepID=UPI001BFCB147|nr:hypothetical protein [Streptomyces sp. CHD11]MBT3155331.1 hypothetical protein [Streptomyces sp. CHD11]